ncbi:phosphatidylinositol glycan anchor biosynthesis class U protein-like protein [Dinothrombium tinctorium]|uniref:Phosphatidylinositol glycan anchor biosynthesis class U protein-like protein n=1 Tax=Dinothrombium tinctorium TaxID=1965070 RepID=A0A443RKT4_9ACAR|nr:phosphatidylinositol glycan anchor biosynthesis class U protein-like protein [Dinothrombium tinctorium]
MSSILRIVGCLSLGIAIRLLFLNSSYQKDISERVEISTPVNSWKRGIEGTYLLKKGISPYEGDTFHETPIFLYFYSFLIDHCFDWIPVIFVLCDVFTALSLGISSFIQLSQNQKRETVFLNKFKESERNELEIKEENTKQIAFKVMIIYALSPYSILTCIAKSTSVFTNLLTSLLMLTASLNLRFLSCFLLALISYQTLYPIMLIVPLIMIIERNQIPESEENSKPVYIYKKSSVLRTLGLFLIILSGLIINSYHLSSQSWNFLNSSYGFLLTVPDFTPNVGLFWYFFTEMFDHFRDFFLWTFQINSFLYVIPLSLTLRKDPNFLFFILLILLSLFKPYPSISDFAIYLALLPQWSHLFNYMKQGLIVACMFTSCSVLAPIMWQMWIILGTANSNYYFGVTLAYNTAQILLITDLLFAFTKRQFYLNKGIMKDKDGKPIQLELAY